MKKILFLAFILFTSIHVVMAQTAADKNSKALLRHVVLFKYKDQSTAADVKKIEQAFRELPSKINLIKDFEFGVNNSPENLNQGLTHCYFLSFSSAKDRDAYLVHPAHKAFTDIAGPHIDKVTVVDYWQHK
ncbi:MAG: Dabb family protein [Chitinophagaceae bacterium]|nr:MAG: Dabb family protein [Chitinophagaceae bacterium]